MESNSLSGINEWRVSYFLFYWVGGDAFEQINKHQNPVTSYVE